MIKRPRLRIETLRDRPTPSLVLGERLDQRPHELAAALRREELLERGDRGIVAVGYREIEPGEAHFHVAGAIEAERGLQRIEAGLHQLARQPVQETKPLVGDPL